MFMSYSRVVSVVLILWGVGSILMFYYVMWNLFTVGNLQFYNDSTIAPLEANENQTKVKYHVNK